MKTALIIIAALIVLGFASFFILGKYSQKGQAPGLVDGKLSKCSEKPNCVASENPNDTDHYIEPLKIESDSSQASVEEQAKIKSAIVSTIKTMNGVVQTEKDHYVSAIFTSSLFGFVDDFEIRYDADQGTIHFRSASRVGYSDGGVNKKRVELFKQLYQN